MKVFFSLTDKVTLGVSLHLPAGHGESLNSSSSTSLAPGGTLTLGADHRLVHGAVEVLPDTALPGWISLFRLWRREWREEEVTSLGCVEGEMVTWWWQDWDLESCTPLSEPGLTCGERERTSAVPRWGHALRCEGFQTASVSDRQSGRSTRSICSLPFSGVTGVARSCKQPHRSLNDG